MTPRESVIAVLTRHAEWCLDQADPCIVGREPLPSILERWTDLTPMAPR